MLVSIIIPTRNEAENLPRLLESTNNQGLKNLEVIVSDNNSTDRTRVIALNYGCYIVKGGNPAQGRNNGAKTARGDILVFKDADSPLPPNFLAYALEEIYERKLHVAGTLHCPLSSKTGFTFLRYRIYMELFANLTEKLIENTSSPHMMNCMFARRKVHEAIGGFDENIEFGEDCEYAKRAKRAGYNFGMLKSCGKIGFNMRNFEEHEIRTLLKNVYFNMGRAFGHEFRRDKTKIKYWDSEETKQK